MSASLRRRIVLGTTVAMSAVVLVGGVAVWFAAHAVLYRTLDDALREQANGLVNLAMLPHGPPRDRAQRPDPEGRPPRPEADGRPPHADPESRPPLAEPDGRPPRPPSDLPVPLEFTAQGGRSFLQIVERGSSMELIRSPSLPAGVSLAGLGPQPQPAGRPLTVRLPDGRLLRLLVTALTHGDGPLRLPPWLRLDPEHRPEARDGRQFDLLLAVDAGPTISDEERLGGVLAVLWLLTTSLGALVAVWLQRAVLRPIDRISQAITGIDPANLHARLAMGDVPDEMRVVMERLNGLLTRLEAAFTRERGTIASIAHELRTPVTGLLMTLELELARLPPAEQPAALGTCFRIATSMQAMITNLLALARSEAGQAPSARRELDLVPLLRDCWSLLAPHANERRLAVHWALPETLVLHSDADQLRMVLTNLLDNAVSYTPPGGSITVSLDAEQLTVRNDTDGSLRDCAQVFQPFWRGDAARAAGLHCGLGLALVERLTASLRGTVRAALDGRGGFVITLGLPR